MAHAHFARHDALDVLAGLLADPEPTARIGAARGLAAAGHTGVTALLRFKLLVGDEAPEVLGACIEALLAIAPDEHADFVIGLLAGHDARSECAAIALGSARIARAFEPLAAWCTGASPSQRHALGYLAIALLRCDPGNDYLLDAIRAQAPASATAAVKALLTFREDAALVERVRGAIADRKDAASRRELGALLD
jgi:hypothetical protein